MAWHAANLARNRRHYSALGALGPAAVAAVADRVGVGVHFNPFVRLNTQVTRRAVAPRGVHRRQHTRRASLAPYRAFDSRRAAPPLRPRASPRRP